MSPASSDPSIKFAKMSAGMRVAVVSWMRRTHGPLVIVSILAGAACGGRVDTVPPQTDVAPTAREGDPTAPLVTMDTGLPPLAAVDAAPPLVATDAGQPPLVTVDAQPWTPSPTEHGAVDPSTPIEVGGDSGVPCVPWAEAPDAPFVADPSHLDLPLTEAIATATHAMTGSWVGRAIAPDPWSPHAWDIMVTFSEDGGYSARAFSAGQETPAFYYGTNLQCPLQRWRLRSVNADGMDGEIDIAFQYPPEGCYLAGWQGELVRVAFDAGSNRMQFEFRRSDGYGPVLYDLWRVCRRA
jgi:hypothetical protein